MFIEEYVRHSFEYSKILDTKTETYTEPEPSQIASKFSDLLRSAMIDVKISGTNDEKSKHIHDLIDTRFYPVIEAQHKTISEITSHRGLGNKNRPKT